MRIAEQQYNDRKSYAHLSRCHYHNKKYKQLRLAAGRCIGGSLGQVVHFRKGNQQQVHSIQHQLDAHKNNDRIAASQYADDANHKQGYRKKYVIIYGHMKTDVQMCGCANVQMG